MTFLIYIGGDLNKCNVLSLYNKMFHHLKQIYNSVSQYYPKISNSSIVKRSERRPMDFKFIDTVSYSILEFTFMKQ